MGMKIGVIGCGIMGTALLQGMVDSGKAVPENTIVYDVFSASTEQAVKLMGVKGAATVQEVVKSSDIIFLAVKPQDMAELLTELALYVDKDSLIVSIAAGITTAYLEKGLGGRGKVVRAMPNTPCLIREGMIVITPGKNARGGELDIVEELLSPLGRIMRLKETHMDAVTGLSGSGPAYTYLLIEAMADGGVEMGLSRTDAQVLAAQAVMGAAKMVMDKNENPSVLKDRVTSPGGTSSAGLMQLEKGIVRYWFIQAVIRATERSRDLGHTTRNGKDK